ncbi:MAG: aromatic ring-hydroxylating dioxygenase subunit alpha [Rhizobiaceae bacterium]|nr:aromatic ring-hydroxylating dioxygenase subunit alpha [Rhizobiaceae bacterium]
MSVTDDPVALNQWIACAYVGQVTPGKSYDTAMLGQAIRISCALDGTCTCHEIGDDGGPGRQLPLSQRFEILFTTLGDTPRQLPDIPEFAEADRRVANCASVGLHASPFRIVENFLDMAHFCFVHKDILGSMEKTEVFTYKTEHRKDVDEIWATDCAFFQPAASTSAAEKGGGQVTYYKYRVMSPFSVMLYKTVYGNAERDDAICLFIQPKSETECIAYMPMAILDDQSTMTQIIDFQQTIFLQDRIILENQRPVLLPLTPSAEIPTKADVSSIAFRRWLKGMGMRFGILQEQAA